jgi:hypothetical protein
MVKLLLLRTSTLWLNKIKSVEGPSTGKDAYEP